MKPDRRIGQEMDMLDQPPVSVMGFQKHVPFLVRSTGSSDRARN